MRWCEGRVRGFKEGGEGVLNGITPPSPPPPTHMKTRRARDMDEAKRREEEKGDEKHRKKIRTIQNRRKILGKEKNNELRKNETVENLKIKENKRNKGK